MEAAAASSPPAFASLAPGSPLPWFAARTTSNPRFVFDTVAGRYIVLGFFVSAGDPAARRAFDAILAHRRYFDDDRACFFGVTLDPRDESEGRLADSIPGIRIFWDFDGNISRAYGSIAKDAQASDGPIAGRPFFVLADPTLRTIAVIPITSENDGTGRLFELLDRQPPPDSFAGFPIQAPVLILPNVFDPGFCEELIALYESHGGEETGSMREIEGKTVHVLDHAHKRRRDYMVTEEPVMRRCQERIVNAVVPEIRKVHQFHVTRMERYLVACYSAEEGGHFRAHRDNTTRGTAHRRFAVSINLNADFDGGEVSFPEYGGRSFKPPPGGAVVFSCSLLHAVSQVTRGRRYAFLPFLYDDAAAKLREENSKYLAAGSGYRA